MEDHEPPPRQRRRIDSTCTNIEETPRRHPAPGNSSTIHDLPNEVLGLCLSFLGAGHFLFAALVCKLFKNTYLACVSESNITCGKSITSSILQAQQYLEDTMGTGPEQLEYFWQDVADERGIHHQIHAAHKMSTRRDKRACVLLVLRSEVWPCGSHVVGPSKRIL